MNTYTFLQKNALILQVIVPLFSAFITFTIALFASREAPIFRRLIHILTIISLFLTLLISIIILRNTLACMAPNTSGGFLLTYLEYSHSCKLLSYSLGGWKMPLGIEYGVNIYNAFFFFFAACMLTLISAIAFLISTWSSSSWHSVLYYPLMLICTAGFLGIMVTNDLFNAFVFLEIASLSSYALVAQNQEVLQERYSIKTAYNYLIMGSIGATFFVLGIGFLYMMTGTLNITDLEAILSSRLAGNPIIQIGFVFIFLGLLIKMGVFLLDRHISQIYTYAPISFAAFSSGVKTSVIFYLLVKILTVLSVNVPLNSLQIKWIFLFFGVLGALIPSFFAIYENNLKRILAYSSLTQVGYLMLGLASMSRFGIAFSFIQLIMHSLAKPGLLLMTGYIEKNHFSAILHDIHGALRYKKLMLPRIIFVFLLLNLIGFPLTLAFAAKYNFLTYIYFSFIVATVQNKILFLTIFITLFISSMLSFIYAGRIVFYLIIKKESSKYQSIVPRFLSFFGAPLGFSVILIYLTFFTPLSAAFTTMAPSTFLLKPATHSSQIYNSIIAETIKENSSSIHSFYVVQKK